MTHWSEKYLDLRYERGGEGPEAYDCWAFARLVQREQFDRTVPAMPSPEGVRSIARVMKPWAEQLGWNSVEAPETGDAVFLANFLHPSHVGIWVGDLSPPRVLHCQQGGVFLHTKAHLAAASWRIHGFYRPVS